MRLTHRQQAFVREYAVSGNATQAAIRAGYSKRRARQQGSENVSKRDIQAAVRKLLEDAAQKAGLTLELVDRALVQALGFDPATCFDDEGNLLPVAQMPLETRRALRGFKGGHAVVDEEGKLVGRQGEELRFPDKIAAAAVAYRRLGVGRDEEPERPAVKITISGINKGKATATVEKAEADEE